MPDFLEPELISNLTFFNPKFFENERMGRWNGKTPKVLKFYERSETGLIIPRGFIRQLLNTCQKHNVVYNITDERRTLPELNFEFNGMLKPFQSETTRVMLKKDFVKDPSPIIAFKPYHAIKPFLNPVIMVDNTEDGPELKVLDEIHNIISPLKGGIKDVALYVYARMPKQPRKEKLNTFIDSTIEILKEKD